MVAVAREVEDVRGLAVPVRRLHVMLQRRVREDVGQFATGLIGLAGLKEVDRDQGDAAPRVAQFLLEPKPEVLAQLRIWPGVVRSAGIAPGWGWGRPAGEGGGTGWSSPLSFFISTMSSTCVKSLSIAANMHCHQHGQIQLAAAPVGQ